MNIFNKLYCRIFQLGFRIALPFLPYRKPKILTENNEIVDVLKLHHINRILLVTDKGIIENNLVSPLLKELEENNINYVIYDQTVPNPTISNVEEARRIYIDNNLQGIIAFGGGSPLDLAKVVGARIVKPNQEVNKMKGVLKICKKTPLLIAIPTTSGTGSEVTIAAVITDEKTHYKYPINDFSLIPDYALLDYKNTLNLPKHLTSTTGMDALTHAVEGYISQTRTKETKEMSLKAIKLIYENLYTCYVDSQNIEARKNMLFASHYAGLSFTKAYVGYVHSIAHALGGLYNIPHGEANSIILPIVLKSYGKSIYKQIKEIAIYIGMAKKEDDKKEVFLKFVSWIEDINEKMNIKSNIPQIKEQDISKIASLASKEANPLYPVPKLYDKKELEKIIKQIKSN